MIIVMRVMVVCRSLQCYGVSIHTSTTVSEVTSSAAHVTNLKTNETFSLDADLVILTSGSITMTIIMMMTMVMTMGMMITMVVVMIAMVIM